MIYCLSEDSYPGPEKIIEEMSYLDENHLEWKIIRVSGGFLIRYLGISLFGIDRFSCDLKNGRSVLVKNTNCIFIQSTDFEVFAEIRDVIKTGYTDDIWDVLQAMFEERLEHKCELLESEIVK